VKKHNIILAIIYVVFLFGCDDDSDKIRSTTQAYVFIPGIVSKHISVKLSTKNLHYSTNSSSWEGEGDLLEFNLVSLEDNKLVSLPYAIDGPQGQLIESASLAIKFDASKDVLHDKVNPATSGTCAIISDTIVEPDDIIRVDYNITVDGKKFKGHYAGPVIFIYGS
jgi:hypothetical protein